MSKSSSEVEIDRMVEAKKPAPKKPAPKKAPAKEMKVGDVSKCGNWQVKAITATIDMVPTKNAKNCYGVATITVEAAKSMMV